MDTIDENYYVNVGEIMGKHSRIEMREKLQKGYTIQQVCQEYNIPFNQLLRKMSRLDKNKRNKEPAPWRATGEMYINQRPSGYYVVRRNKKHFGTFNTLADAVKVRDWFITHRWDKRWVDRACNECGVVRRKKS